MLNGAHALVGSFAKNKEMANEFLDWVIGSDGQEIMRTFSANGVALYAPAPAASSRSNSRVDCEGS
jgi:ABC-type Fe3+ transport system substrate-binding protein